MGTVGRNFHLQLSDTSQALVSVCTERWCAMSMNVVKRMYLHSLCICNYTYGVLLLMDIFIYLIFYFWQRC